MYHHRGSSLTRPIGTKTADLTNDNTLSSSLTLDSGVTSPLSSYYLSSSSTTNISLDMDMDMDMDIEKSIDDSHHTKRWTKRCSRFPKFFKDRFYFYRWFRSNIKTLFNNKWSFFVICTVFTIFITFNQLSFNSYYHPNTQWSYLEIDKSTRLSNEQMDEIEVRYLHNEFSKSPKYNYNNVNKRFDLRITPAFYLDNILNSLAKNDYNLNEHFKIPFSWLDWINFDERLYPSMKYLSNSNGKPISSCLQFSYEIGFPKAGYFQKDKLINCENLSNLEITQLKNPNYPNFRITGPLIHYGLTVDARIVHGASYLYHEFPSPDRLIFVEGSNKFDLIIPIQDNNRISRESVLNKIVRDDNKEGFEVALEKIPSIDELMSLIHSNIQNKPISNENTSRDISRISQNMKIDNEEIIRLVKEDFINPKGIEEIEQLLYDDDFESFNSKLYRNILNDHKSYPDGDYPKYFYEADSNEEKVGGSHYDWRFYNFKDLDNEYKRISILKRMIRAWLRFTNNENINTWLGHGTLLGYSFNRQMLPWDFDHDVQVSSQSMWKLATYFNQSLIIDCTTKDKFSTGFGQYFLDVSSNFYNRSNTNGNNSIDARFIDIHSGMYIDITQLSDVLDKEKKLQKDVKKLDEFIGAEYYRFLKQHETTVDKLLEQDDLISCKNNHFYTLKELSVFKKVIFEEEHAYIPAKYADILDREFPERKTLWKHEKHSWDPKKRLWMKDRDWRQLPDWEGVQLARWIE